MGFAYTQRQHGLFPNSTFAPDKPGVYGIFNGYGTFLYIGMTDKSIRERLLAHAKGDESPVRTRCLKDRGASRYTYELNSQITGPLSDRETALIQEYSPSCQ